MKNYFGESLNVGDFVGQLDFLMEQEEKGYDLITFPSQLNFSIYGFKSCIFNKYDELKIQVEDLDEDDLYCALEYVIDVVQEYLRTDNFSE